MSSITIKMTKEPMKGLHPTNTANDTWYKPTARNYVADAANITETVITTLLHTTQSQLLNKTSKELVALTNSNPPTVQPPKYMAKNNTADTNTPQKFTITFDPTKVFMMNTSKRNQTTKKDTKEKWSYELLNDMYTRSGYIELYANIKTVYWKYCNESIVTRQAFD